MKVILSLLLIVGFWLALAVVSAMDAVRARKQPLEDADL
jgi:hypothetical protein